MKKFLTLLLLAVSTTALAQFKLTGKILHYRPDAGLNITIPAVTGFFTEDIRNIPIAKNGSFTITLPVKIQKFGYLKYQTNTYPLLLTKNKTLSIELDALNKGIKIIAGTAQAENELIQRINLAEVPSFLLDDGANLRDIDALNNQLLKPYYAKRDRKIAQVNQAAISPINKRLIIAELKYKAYNHLYELTDIGADNPALLNRFVANIYSKATVKPETMPAGPEYYIFVNNYLNEIEKKTPGKQTSAITRWGSALKYLPAAVTEQFGYYLITRSFYNSDTNGKVLCAAYLKKFPAGVYTAAVKAKAAKMK